MSSQWMGGGLAGWVDVWRCATDSMADCAAPMLGAAIREQEDRADANSKS